MVGSAFYFFEKSVFLKHTTVYDAIDIIIKFIYAGFQVAFTVVGIFILTINFSGT